jgi:hypothetical protein
MKRIRKLLGTYSVEKILIVPYRSYGSCSHVYVKGRVLDNPPLQYNIKQSFGETLRNAIDQFNTHEFSI